MSSYRNPSHDHHVVIILSDEEMAAVEGWRDARALSTKADAARQLIRLGLLNEIARIYRDATSRRAPVNGGRHDGVEDYD